ncbi:MAG: ABC transporter ATP-binding protein [Deltaproteobacteria bacterium]|nr:ABC transporter ATP-binding protein [Deltaproteobacteria bacterium]
MTDAIYHITDLTHCYEDKQALAVKALSIRSKSIVGLMGPNGSGKSTLLKILSFAMLPTRGQVLFNGRPARPFSDSVRFQVTLLTQNPYLMKRSVFENVRYGLRVRGDTHNIEQRVFDALSWVGLSPDHFAQRKWHQLSGGEAQRVALAARLILKPRVLLLDEPLSSVDAASAQRIKEAALRARRKWGTTLIIASHDRQWLFDICDELYFMFQGNLLKSGLETIVFGPWQVRTDDLWEKRLGDGQTVVVSKPPHSAAVAMIPSHALAICQADQSDPGPGGLRGTISHLFINNPTGDIVATVQIADLSITTRLPKSENSPDRFYPGQTVCLKYQPEKIVWY